MSEVHTPTSNQNGAPYTLALVRDALGQGGIDEGLKLSKGVRVGSLEIPAGAGDVWIENSIRYSTALSAGCFAASQVLASGTAWTALTLQVKHWDTDEMVDLATYPTRFTFKTGGIYAVSGSAVFEDNSNGYRGLGFLLNNLTLIHRVHTAAIAGLAQCLSLCGIYPFDENDFLEFCGVQNSGSSLDVGFLRFAAARIA